MGGETAEELPEDTWEELALKHWRGRFKHLVSYNWIKHQPNGSLSVSLFTALRHKREYFFIKVENGRAQSCSRFSKA